MKTRTVHPMLECLECRTTPSIFAAGGAPGHVEVFAAAGGANIMDFEPYGLGYSGKISLAVADFNRDGIKDLVTAPSEGSPLVKIFDGQDFFNGQFEDSAPDESLLAQAHVYGTNFNVGASVAAGDVNQDGFIDLITGATIGNPHVKVFSGQAIVNGSFNQNPNAGLLASFFAYAVQFNVGSNVAAGDLNRDGFAEVITAANAGNPHVKAYDGKAIAQGNFANPSAHQIVSFFPFALQFNVGATVAVGDTNGDSYVDLITGSSVGNPDVRVYSGKAIAQGGFNNFNPSASQLTQFFAYALQGGNGVRVSSIDFDGNGAAEIMTGNTTGPGRLRIVSGNATGVNPPALYEQTFGDDWFLNGLSVGA